ncbi:MAG: amidase family protein [Gammaproteobacteria bacterium]|nr:amidase family protein [Gammaproteobacteria bacterium]MDH3468180.1 amidase family protein [Gammaproteobacteria bacterium]
MPRKPDSVPELCQLTATEAVTQLRRGEISPLDLVDAAAQRIALVEPHLNALPTLCIERARDAAEQLMANPPADADRPGWLGGLPVAIKDLNDVAGVRTTYGSPIYADHVPTRSDIMVEQLEANGAIVIAKSNTPEFGAGASTFNEVFGKTRNPWNVEKSVAGSSGGASAAVASGEVWLATGSDLGGSLRTPASFNSVVGLRPSPGRVARGPLSQPFDTLMVEGPIARNAADCALLLDAMCGRHREDPISLARPTESFSSALAAARPPKRVAFSPNLGIVPVDREVIAVCEQAAQQFESMGAIVERACPDFSEVIESFQILRASIFAAGHADHLRDHRAKLKPEVIWNIEKGLALTAEQIGRAEAARARLYANSVAFFDSYDLLLCPAAIVPPFDVDVRYVEEVDGERFDNYVHWISITFAITATSCPALSAPAGFTAAGLPVGLQIVAPPQADAAALSAAALLEQATGFAGRLPIDPHDNDGRNLLNIHRAELGLE